MRVLLPGLIVMFIALAAIGARYADGNAGARTADQPTPEAFLATTAGVRPSLSEGRGPTPGETRRRERDEPEPTTIIEAPQTGIGLGWGWNTFHSEAVPTVCVEFDAAKPYTGQITNLDFTEVNDSYEMAVALDMSMEGSVKTMAYEVKGEAKFAASAEVSSTNTTYVIEAEVLNSPTVASPAPRSQGRSGSVRLTREAADLARRDVELFKDVCGNGYISATMGGAKLSALISIKTETARQKTSMSSSVEGGGWGVKVKAAMSGSSSSGTDKFRREINFYQAGGIDQDLPTDPDMILARVRELARAANEAEIVFRIAVTPYEVLENWPREDEITGKQVEFEKLAALWGAYEALWAEIEDVLETPARYVVPARRCGEGGCFVTFETLDADALARVEALQDEALATLDRLEIAARVCVQSEEDCDTDVTRYRSPYAMRVRMPINGCQLLTDLPPGLEAAQTAAYQKVRQEQWALYAAEYNKTRANDQPALSAATIDADFRPNPVPPGPVCGTENLNHKVQVPVPGAEAEDNATPPTVEVTMAKPDVLEAYGDVMVAEIAKSRCRLGSLTPGCLLNSSIAAWRDRVGMASVILPSDAAVAEIVAAVATLPDVSLGGDPETRLATSLWYPVDLQAEVANARDTAAQNADTAAK